MALFPRTWARPRPALPSSDGITVCTLGSKELHNSLSAKALESPSVAVSAASLPRQQQGLKKQQEGGGLDSYQTMRPDTGAGSQPHSSSSRAARPGTTGQGWGGSATALLAKDNLPRFSQAPGLPDSFQQVSFHRPALCSRAGRGKATWCTAHTERCTLPPMLYKWWCTKRLGN